MDKAGKVALITGITGQDGSYLTELLLEKGYQVHGIIRRASTPNTSRIAHLVEDPSLFLHFGDLSDSLNIVNIVKKVQPDEIYSLGALSHVGVSFDSPEYVADVDGIGTLRLLEAIRINGLTNKTKFYQASTSELYGLVQETPQSETTPFYPRSPYGVAKLYAYWIVKNYRESYGMHASNGILYNHESPRRGEDFVTRKITKALSNIKKGKQSELRLGNLDAKRDWGHSKDFCRAMWMMLQHETPDDYVIATGKQYSVRDFVRIAASRLDITLRWEGEGINEVGIVTSVKDLSSAKDLDYLVGKSIIVVDEEFFRPSEVETLLGDATKAKNVLGWEPEISFDELVNQMIERDFYGRRF